jgi:hypothetical protein
VSLALLLLALAQDPRALLDAHCVSCHGATKQKGKVDLRAPLDRDAGLWSRALAQLRGRSMPPEDEPQPTEADRESLAAALEAAVDRIDAKLPPDAGRPVLRRLNRAEYTNSVRDLFGIDLRPAEDFPADDVHEGFDTVGEVLSLPPLLLEKYLDAAERILDQAVGDGPVLDRTFEAEALAPKAATSDLVRLPFDREIALTVRIPDDGRYTLSIRAGVQGAEATISVIVDGLDVAILKADAPASAPDLVSATFPLRAGERRIQVRHSPPKAYAKDEKVPDITLAVDALRLSGPERALSHRRIVAEGLERFAERAYRRPLAPGDLDRPLALLKAGGLRRALWAVLVSPRFLFRIERDTADRDANGQVRLDDWELASRLSYFLWSSMPDERLFELARQKRLREPAVLAAEARRMLGDPKARALVDGFFGQWLGTRRLDQAQPDRDLFPMYTETLRRALRDEMELFFAGLVREDRGILELLHADYGYLNEALARHYGIKDVKGEAMRRVTFPDSRRGGVVTMGGVLVLTSYPTRTSAVKRGKWLLDEILGAPPPPPPPDVPELDQAGKGRPDAATLTPRQRLEIHRALPACYGCHKRMDVLGLGFENFDAVGRWRDKEAGRPIDASGTLPTGERFSGPGELKKILLESRDDFARTMAEKTLVYALGRPLVRSDRREVKRIIEGTRNGGYRFSALVEAVVTSYPFRFRRPPTAEETR